MKSGEWRITLDQGGDWNPTLTAVDQLTSAPEDLTGYTAIMEICERYGEAPKITLTTENGGITLGGVAGTIAFSLSKANIAANLPVPDSPGIPPTKTYVHSVRLMLGAVTLPYLHGPCVVRRKTGV